VAKIPTVAICPNPVVLTIPYSGLCNYIEDITRLNKVILGFTCLKVIGNCGEFPSVVELIMDILRKGAGNTIGILPWDKLGWIIGWEKRRVAEGQLFVSKLQKMLLNSLSNLTVIAPI
jgi:hypothetical protein